MSTRGYVLDKLEALHTAAVLTANGTALQTRGFEFASLQVTGIIGDTITPEVTIDGTNWVGTQVSNEATGALSTTITADGIYNIVLAGKVQFRARLARVGGTVTVTSILVTSAPSSSFADIDLVGSENVTLLAGTALAGKFGIDQATANANEVVVKSALPAGTNNIGDVDVLTSVQPVGLSTVACGELQGNAAATQMPSVACKYVKFKAVGSNVGNVYVGGASVTKVDGTTDTTTGFELGAGEETGWLPATNLNLFYRICDNAGDDLTYLALT